MTGFGRRRFCRRVISISAPVTLMNCGLWIAAMGASGRSVAATPSADSASAFLLAYSDKSVGMLTEPGIGQSETEVRFRKLLVEGFDLPAIGAFVLGRFARTASQEQKQLFLEAFKDAMTQRFLPLFSKHPEERLEILHERPSEQDPKSVIVSTLIKHPKAKPIRIDWRIRKRDGNFKIIDIAIEGVSMAITLRSEYTAVIVRHDGRIEPLTDMLRKRVASDTFSPDRRIRELLD